MRSFRALRTPNHLSKYKYVIPLGDATLYAQCMFLSQPIERSGVGAGSITVGEGCVSPNGPPRQCAGRKGRRRKRVNVSGGGGFVIDTATLSLLLVGIGVLAGIWLWLHKKGARKP
jgi:hypothetical protein